METDFKFKVGDIVKVTSDWWPNGARKYPFLCVITRQLLLDDGIVNEGIKGEKYKYYEVQYDFHAFQSTTCKYENEDISLLSEYWYINDDFEICKETDVKLTKQFIHRAYGFGVFLTEKDAKYRCQHLKYKCRLYELL